VAISPAPWYTAGVTLGRRIGAGAAIGIVVVAVLATAGAASFTLTVNGSKFNNNAVVTGTVRRELLPTSRRSSSPPRSRLQTSLPRVR